MRNSERTQRIPALVLLAVVVCGGCNKKEDPAPPAGPGGGGGGGGSSDCTTGTLAFEGRAAVQFCLDGTLHMLEHDDVEVINSGFQTSFLGGMRYTSRFHAMAINDFRYGVEVGLFADNGGSPTEQQFIDYFAPGEWEHGFPAGEQGKAAFFWREAGGAAPWSTYCDPGSQPDFTFTISHSEPFVEDGELHVKVRATFSGTVYNCSGTGSKQVTHGTVVTVFRRGD